MLSTPKAKNRSNRSDWYVSKIPVGSSHPLRAATQATGHFSHSIRLPSEAPEDKVSRALETHVSKCPTAQSIKDSVEITWSVEFVEE